MIDSLLFDYQNYLRVRGEYLGEQILGVLHPELPPRTRRIPMCSKNEVGRYGTTSAYAENTPTAWIAGLMNWNYLRVRGEYPK